MNMASLVADYSSDSSNSEDERSSETAECLTEASKTSEKLPSPEFLKNEPHTSVFSNPFREAEEAQNSLLEKHVKMTSVSKQTTSLNGKQICWNYRKGRCRFGHNCKFAHDNDAPNYNQNNVTDKSNDTTNGQCYNQTEQIQTEKRKKKKRPGLTQGLVPSKKIMKMYNQQNAKTFSKV